MKPQTTKMLYWIFTCLFAALKIMDGIGGVTRQQAGIEVMLHLGYPIYAMVILGTAKFLGAFVVLQTKYTTIKEWAYAGFAFNLIGAFASRAFMSDPIRWTVLPLIILAFMFVPYFLWKKIENTRAVTGSAATLKIFAL